MDRSEGKIFITGFELKTETLFNLEQELNNVVATKISRKFGVVIRVHLYPVNKRKDDLPLDI